jgi:hypothetical protein
MPKWMAAAAFALVMAAISPCDRSARADEGDVDLLLVLAADVSRSVDEAKFKLQREGYAAAITDPRVVSAMMAGQHRRIAVCYIEWASDREQKVLINWAPIGSEGDAKEVAERLRNDVRSFWGRTSISAAIDFSMREFDKSPFKATRRVIDISGDGTNNSGRDVTLARDAAVAQGVTINGLVILSEVPLPTNPAHTHPPGGLTAYYENNVVGGPGAFVVEAEGFHTFGQSIISKLIKEIADAGPSRLGETSTE